MSEEKGAKEKIVGKFLAVKSLIKRMLRARDSQQIRRGFPVHDVPTPGFDVNAMAIFKELNQLINFKNIREMNNRMVETELKWEGSVGYHGDYVEKIRGEIIEAYTKEGKEIGDSIGFYSDSSSGMIEGNYAEYGTGTTDTWTQIKNNRYEYKIPALKPIVYDDGRAEDRNGEVYKIAFFGSTNSPYWENLNKRVDEICEDVKRRVSAGKSDEDKKKIHLNVEYRKTVIKNILGELQIKIGKNENDHRGALKGANAGALRHFSSVYTALEKIEQSFKLTDQHVHYTHTYKVLKTRIPKIVVTPTKKIDPDTGQEKIEDVFSYVTEKKKKIVNGKEIEIENIVWDELKDYLKDWKREEEIELGLDENGWPLEVGDGVTGFEGGVHKKGEILIDKYKGRNPRVLLKSVYDKFVKDIDPLEKISWIYVHYDSYRDDMRDARYHKDAITVMEQIMAELGVYPDKMQEKFRKWKHAEPEIKLNVRHYPNPEDYGRFNSDPSTIKRTIRTSNYIPAFDLRALKNKNPKAKHLGHKYYYETQNECEQSDQPTITTRGATMYILHRVIEDTKYWGDSNDPKKIGVLQLLKAIGEETGGFDIGPNMGPQGYDDKGEPTYPGWGKPLSKDPFNPKRY